MAVIVYAISEYICDRDRAGDGDYDCDCVKSMFGLGSGSLWMQFMLLACMYAM